SRGLPPLPCPKFHADPEASARHTGRTPPGCRAASSPPHRPQPPVHRPIAQRVVTKRSLLRAVVQAVLVGQAARDEPSVAAAPRTLLAVRKPRRRPNPCGL